MIVSELDFDPASEPSLLRRSRRPARVALVHDWLTGMHSGEHVLAAIAELFPSAEIFTLICTPDALEPSLARRPTHTSWLQAVPGAPRYYRHLLPLMPSLIESLDLTGFDLVISSSHSVAKGVRKPKGSVHVSYVHAPMRYMWSRFDDYFGPTRASFATRTAARLVRRYLQRWDRESSAADRVDLLVANSEFVAAQMEYCYERESLVVHPFAELSRFAHPRKTEDYYLMVGAFAPNERVDIAIQAFNRSKLPLYVVGRGPGARRLEALAGPNVRFLGAPSDREIAELYAGARALVAPGVEDFGITPIEAMASGVPVIAYAAGSATETVIDGVTGILFRPQSVRGLAEAVRRVHDGEIEFDPARLRAHARRFSKGNFQRQFLASVRQAWLRAGKDALELPTDLPH